ncbi:50S ribosomal protein L3 N(5)-glutamine methyltransferase [Wenzhouxiangella marina]|uniref:50S ribosomal protein L3 glutamine methyltransferase n=1 Tax=Wenzhouxiangella marina TaxID=1579979 RepID=A0A0K0XY36_9GAMM|nr:50S ribosomal protein L3 N(5)-glutamine methyltransferase [Wenzhouxiangella marina]AKS42585.1 50S ribosomal protein L3 glutamine methyltransferase [Wenzhouxiangella marina]MBB6085633.1 ribosomal protein L3 glutamine methyltransferase [Wenzhouxiangella marina]
MSASTPTLEDWIREAAERMDMAGLYFGHGTDNALDEACWLASSALAMPPDFDASEFSRGLESSEIDALDALLERRIESRMPLAYLLGTAWLAGLEFEVSPDVLVPRSPIAELILDGFEPWLSAEQLTRAADVGTGSGCLAIALARHWPECEVDAFDISPPALELARRNVRRHGLEGRVHVIESDLLSAAGAARYDLILANPPYVPSASMESLPAEFLHEPRLGLEAGEDGLDLVRRLLTQVPAHLSEHGILICEVGEAAEALQALLAPAVEPVWLEFANGGDGVFLLDAEACRRAAEFLLDGGRVSTA